MANLQKRGSYTPRRLRERRAYQLALAGAGSGVAGVVALVLAVAGVISGFWPILLFAIAVTCVVLFRNVTGQR